MGRAEYNAAIKHFEKCVSLDPGYAKAYAFMGLAYSYLKNETLATWNLAKAKELCSKGADCAGLNVVDSHSSAWEKELANRKLTWREKIRQSVSLERIGGLYLIIFPLIILLSLFFGFSLQSILIIVAGLIASIIARVIFNNVGVANAISYVFALFAGYFVFKSEVYHS